MCIVRFPSDVLPRNSSPESPRNHAGGVGVATTIVEYRPATNLLRNRVDPMQQCIHLISGELSNCEVALSGRTAEEDAGKVLDRGIAWLEF